MEYYSAFKKYNIDESYGFPGVMSGKESACQNGER